MLSEIAAILMKQNLVSSTWQSEVTLQGEMVALCREYYEGQHRLNMTSEMRQMMQINDDRTKKYNANYCEMVVNQMADRLTVDTIEAKNANPTPSPSPNSGRGENANTANAANAVVVQEKQINPAQEWADKLLEDNRFDALQIDVREAALRDGVTFVMVETTKDNQSTFYHELAWDGDYGTMVVYDRQGREIVAGVKVWYEGETRRANIYYRNSMARYQYEKVEIEENGQKREEWQFSAMDKKPVDTTWWNQEPGVPIIPFFNKSKKGSSELVNVIPLQDSLNSTLVSMVMNALLTAFAILFAKGFKPPSGITPGMIIHAAIFGENDSLFVPEDKEIGEAVAALMATYSLERIQPGEVEPLIRQCEFIIQQIGTVSLTPVPGLMGGDSQSGEALQERRIGQLGKVNAAQVRLGNSWEDVIALAHTQQEVFGTQKPPPSDGWNCRWKNAEIRNDTNVLKLAELLFKWGFEREGLRRLSQLPGINYSPEDIAKLMAEKQGDAQLKVGAAAGETDPMAGFGFN